MKKTFKKIISLVLVLVMLMSVGAMAASAEDSTAETDNIEEHGSFISIFVRFALEIFNFFKYIFHDLWLGKPPV